jgi:hypothetical protein
MFFISMPTTRLIRGQMIRTILHKNTASVPLARMTVFARFLSRLASFRHSAFFVASSLSCSAVYRTSLREAAMLNNTSGVPDE